MGQNSSYSRDPEKYSAKYSISSPSCVNYQASLFQCKQRPLSPGSSCGCPGPLLHDFLAPVPFPRPFPGTGCTPTTLPAHTLHDSITLLCQHEGSGTSTARGQQQTSISIPSRQPLFQPLSTGILQNTPSATTQQMKFTSPSLNFSPFPHNPTSATEVYAGPLHKWRDGCSGRAKIFPPRMAFNTTPRAHASGNTFGNTSLRCSFPALSHSFPFSPVLARPHKRHKRQSRLHRTQRGSKLREWGSRQHRRG